MAIQEDAGRIICALAEFEESPTDSRRGRYNLTGEGVRQALVAQQEFEMEPDRINDAIALLEGNGYVKLMLTLGTAPYKFRGVELTPRGRLEYEKLKERQKSPGASAPTPDPPGRGEHRVFIGHGHSPVWRELKDFLSDRLELRWEEFNREATAGLSTKERLQAMLTGSTFAFLVMTAEDERADGAKTARANVVHEVGLFQGRLGFERAIVVLEEGCEEFSNILGISQIRFPRNNISAAFEEIRRVLEREKIVEAR